MAERAKHLFQFRAEKIAEAAANEALYHADRITFWRCELEVAKAKVRDTARVEFIEREQTGGSRLDVTVNFGDPNAYARMGESQGKIERHRAQRERFQIDATLYGTQGGHVFLLDGEDVAHFRLNGRPREE